ncbi:MAG: hypothetical protein HYS74_02470 [Parcubacteria group bacterium]|nr:hypothetical protein [Parcubacteria group bacterium]
MTTSHAKTSRFRWAQPAHPDRPDVSVDEYIANLWNNGKNGNQLTGREICCVLAEELGRSIEEGAVLSRLQFLKTRGLATPRGSGSHQIKYAGTGKLKEEYRAKRLKQQTGKLKKCLGGCGRMILTTPDTRTCPSCRERNSQINRFMNI